MLTEKRERKSSKSEVEYVWNKKIENNQSRIGNQIMLRWGLLRQAFRVWSCQSREITNNA